jgi:hypothetical protein
MFNGYYKMRPTWRDVAYVLAHGPSLGKLARLGKRVLRP